MIDHRRKPCHDASELTVSFAASRRLRHRIVPGGLSSRHVEAGHEGFGRRVVGSRWLLGTGPPRPRECETTTPGAAALRRPSRSRPPAIEESPARYDDLPPDHAPATLSPGPHACREDTVILRILVSDILSLSTYLWEAGECREHIHEPVDEQNFELWTGRSCRESTIATSRPT